MRHITGNPVYSIAANSGLSPSAGDANATIAHAFGLGWVERRSAIQRSSMRRLPAATNSMTRPISGSNHSSNTRRRVLPTRTHTTGELLSRSASRRNPRPWLPALRRVRWHSARGPCLTCRRARYRIHARRRDRGQKAAAPVPAGSCASIRNRTRYDVIRIA